MVHTPHTWVEINKTALDHNLNQLKLIIGPNILAPVIKGNAYGHGLLEVGRVCQKNKNVEYLCVASLSDALNLRNAYITKPIVVLAYIDDNPEYAIEKNIDIVVHNEDFLQKLSNCGKKLQKNCSIHIKIDTGLCRLGITPNKAFSFIKKALTLPFITIKGISTHFAQSHKKNQLFTNKQIKIFQHLCSQLKKNDITFSYQHACNSAATLKSYASIGNFFRVGISIYGYWPSTYIQKKTIKQFPATTLVPILTWKSRIFAIKKVSAGTSVGYDLSYTTTKKTVLAFISVGYLEGYQRAFSNKASVMVNGQYAPVVGKISMNTTTIDVSNIKNIKIGMEVSLIGNHQKIRADFLSTFSSKNPREITTGISAQIPRNLLASQ
ncbi:alanine racemase [bacterium]|nr:alanine racemase [bacterium]